MARMDHYDTLGVGRRASTWEIKAAYRELVRRLHPDSNPGTTAAATDRLLEVQRAYEVLSHPGRRASYDAGISEGIDTVLVHGGVADALEGILDSVLDTVPADTEPEGAAEDTPEPQPRTGEEEPAAPERPERHHPMLAAGLAAAALLVATTGYWLVRSTLPGLPEGSLTELLTLFLVAVLVVVLFLLGSWALSYVDDPVTPALRRGAERIRLFRLELVSPRLGAARLYFARAVACIQSAPAAGEHADATVRLERWIGLLDEVIERAGPRHRGGAESPMGRAQLAVTVLVALLLLGITGISNVLVVAGPGPGWLDQWQGPALVGAIAGLAGGAFAALEREESGSPLHPLLMTVNLATVAGTAVSGYLAWYRSDVAQVVANAIGLRPLGTGSGIRFFAGLAGLVVIGLLVYLGAVAWHHFAELVSPTAPPTADTGSGRQTYHGRRPETDDGLEEPDPGRAPRGVEGVDGRGVLAFVLDFARFAAWAGALAAIAVGLSGARAGLAAPGPAGFPGLPLLLPLGISLAAFATARLLEVRRGPALFAGTITALVPLAAGGVWAVALLGAPGAWGPAADVVPGVFFVGLLAVTAMELDAAVGAGIAGSILAVATIRLFLAQAASIIAVLASWLLRALATAIRLASAPGGGLRSALGGGNL